MNHRTIARRPERFGPDDRREASRGRQIRKVATAVATTLALVGITAPVWADQQGSFDSGQADSSHASWSTVAGTKIRVATDALITDPTASSASAVVQANSTDYGDLWSPNVDASQPGAKLGVASTVNANGQWTFPVAWDHDQKWHPAARVTLTFNSPVQNPILDVSQRATLFYHTTSGTTDAGGVSASQIRLTGVTSSTGAAVTPTMTATDNNNQLASGSFKMTTAANGDPVFTPGLINGQIPYMNYQAPWCYTGEQTADFRGKSFLDSRYSNIHYSSGGCASLKIDTHGEAVSSVTLELDQSYASANSAGGSWNYLSFTGYQVVPVIPQELSGVNTPTSLGVASHAVSDLRIGKDIVAARADKISDAMLSPTAASNSDSGYVADSELVRAQLHAYDTGDYTVTVPYSHVNRTAYLNGWIDFNGNGKWDAGESATAVKITADASGSGTATLTFKLPANLAAQPNGVTARFRIADSASDVANPTGYAASGEVEDHIFTIAKATGTGGLEVHKAVSKITAADGTERGADATAQKGDTVTYGVTVTNDSPYAMKDVAVSDTLLKDGLACVDSNNQKVTLPAKLAAGATLDCSGTYVVTAADVTAKTVHNVATADAQWDDPNVTPGDVPEASDEANVPTDPSAPTGGLEIHKSVSKVTAADGTERGADADAQKGDTVTYGVDVTNNSPYAMKDVTLSDTLLKDGLTCVDADKKPVTLPAKLAAGATLDCSGTYVVTAADVTAKTVHNVATAGAQWDDPTVTPGDVTPVDDDADVPTTPSAPTGGIEVHKSVSKITAADGTERGANATAQKGDTISYGVTVTNDSPYAMKNVDPTDTLLKDGLACVDSNNQKVTLPAKLAAGATIDCSGTYVVTAADVTAKAVHNVATADAQWDDPTVTPGDVPPASDDADVPTDPSAPTGGLEIHKAVSKITAADGTQRGADATAQKGDTVTYGVTVTNDSPYAMKDVTPVDTLLKGGLTCVDADKQAVKLPASLAAGAKLDCSGTYVVTADDVKAKTVHNVATADAKWDDPTVNPGDVTPVDDDADVPATPTTPVVDPTNGPTSGPSGTTGVDTTAPTPTVQPTAGHKSGLLAHTGANVIIFIGLALALVAAGALIVIGRRRTANPRG